MMSEVGNQLNDLHDTDIAARDQEWRQDRRLCLERYNTIWRTHELECDAREQDFARAVMQVLKKGQ